MNLTISPTRQGYSVSAVLYEHLDDGSEAPLADIPPTDIPASTGDRDALLCLLDCLMFWCRLQGRHAGEPKDVYLPIDWQ